MMIYSSSLGPVYGGLIADGLESLVASLMPTSVIILADDNTAQHCLPAVKKLLPEAREIIIPAGEIHKNLDSCRLIWSGLAEMNIDRQGLLLNVGGGMICDLGGFTASCYQRGIRFAHIPTSVLSMADAAYGGKTGIDFEGFKNYIGTFQAPSFVWMDSQFLHTLPRVEKISGLAEIVKHAIIASPELWDNLLTYRHSDNINWDETLIHNLPVKLRIAEADPRETGLRKILNFGHTIGHALESHFLSSEQPLTHGQCIALGMLAEAKIAASMEILNLPDFKAIEDLVNQLLEPVRISLPTFEELNSWIQKDKKKSGQKVGFSLPDRIGSCGWDIPVEEHFIKESILYLAQVH